MLLQADPDRWTAGPECLLRFHATTKGSLSQISKQFRGFRRFWPRNGSDFALASADA